MFYLESYTDLYKYDCVIWEMREGGGGEGSTVSSRFIFVFALSQFRGPDYLGAWNRPRDLRVRSQAKRQPHAKGDATSMKI